MMVGVENFKRGLMKREGSGNADRRCSSNSSSADCVGEGRRWDLHLYNECLVQQRFSESTSM